MRTQLQNHILKGLAQPCWPLKQLSCRTLGIGLAALALVASGDRSAASETPITLAAGEAEVQGVTGGELSFLELAARDRRRKLCLGYGRQNPDYVLELTAQQPQLRIAVESGGDTTLLVQGPEGIDCNDNYRREHQDAAVTANNLPAGTYRIWVGAFNRGDELSYTLRVFDPENLNEDAE